MTIVIGYVVAAAVTISALWIVAGRHFIGVRDPEVNLAEVAGKHVGIMSGLAGYAVTGMVLLVTLGRSLSDTSTTTYTTVVTMFFVSWMAYAATAFLFANISDHDPEARRHPANGFLPSLPVRPPRSNSRSAWAGWRYVHSSRHSACSAWPTSSL